ncbi:hypothetical protein L211DRAFT_848792 [Terfezia boudieri ATCC MYA-4762]|uniref:Uncharacterized protein n=1 Tax=Terfezia boudieri ATCC MYA-4762 TaxID=1051890 RepID=A0A3N4LNI5_9PEZI|nr:hypothetical protein L211DRAFT_848792 [Terfezia boudieri ATCC MYA-4762]
MSYAPPTQPPHGSYSNRHSMPAQPLHHRHPHSHPSEPIPRQPYPNIPAVSGAPPHHHHHQRGTSYPTPTTAQFQPQSQPPPLPHRGGDQGPLASLANRGPANLAATTYLISPATAGPLMSNFFAQSPKSRGLARTEATAYAIRMYLEVFLYYLGYDPSTGSPPQTFIELKEAKLGRELGLPPDKARLVYKEIWDATTPSMEKVCLGIIGMEEKLGCSEDMVRAVRFLFKRNHGMTPEEMLAGGGKVVGVYGETILEELVLPGLIRERKKNGGLGPSGAADSGSGEGGAWKKIWKKGWKFGGRKEGEGGEGGPMSPTGPSGAQGAGLGGGEDSSGEREVEGEESLFVDQGPQAPPAMMSGVNGPPGVIRVPHPQPPADSSALQLQESLIDRRESRDIEGQPQRSKSQRQQRRLKPMPQQQIYSPMDSPSTNPDPELIPQAVDPLASISSRTHHFRRRSETVGADSSPTKPHSSMRRHRERRERSGSMSAVPDGAVVGPLVMGMAAMAAAIPSAATHHQHQHERKQSRAGGGGGEEGIEDPFGDRPAPEDMGEARVKNDSKQRRKERRESRQPVDSRERARERERPRDRERDRSPVPQDHHRGADPPDLVPVGPERGYYEQLQREQMRREQLLREHHAQLQQMLQPQPQPQSQPYPRDQGREETDRELVRDIPPSPLRHAETDPQAAPLPEAVFAAPVESRPQTGNANAPLPPPVGESRHPSRDPSQISFSQQQQQQQQYQQQQQQQQQQGQQHQQNGSTTNTEPIPMSYMAPEEDPFMDQVEGPMPLPLPPPPLFFGSNSRPGSRNSIGSIRGSAVNLPLPPSTTDLRPDSGRGGGQGSVGREAMRGSRPETARGGDEYGTRPGTARGSDRVNTAVPNGHGEGLGAGGVGVDEGVSPSPAYIHPDEESGQVMGMGMRLGHLEPPQAHELSQPQSLDNMRALGIGMGMRAQERFNQQHISHPNHHQHHHHHHHNEHRHLNNHHNGHAPEAEQDPQETDSIIGGNTEVSSRLRRRTRERESDRDRDRSHTRDKDKDREKKKRSKDNKDKEKERGEGSSKHKHKHRDGTDAEKDQRRRKEREEKRDKERSVRAKDAEKKSQRSLPEFGNSAGTPGLSTAAGYDGVLQLQQGQYQVQEPYSTAGGLTSVENTPSRERRHKRERSSHTRHRERSRPRDKDAGRERDRSQAPGEGMTTGGEGAERAERKERRRKEKKEKERRREKEKGGSGGGEAGAGESASVSNTGGEALRRRRKDKDRERVDRDKGERERERMEKDVHAQGGIVV